MRIEARVEGVGFWGSGLPSWERASAFARGTQSPVESSLQPSASLLPPNERRRAPVTVALALESAQQACIVAGADPATLPAVFTSTHGELGITDFMCATLVDDPTSISPTKFHNSVHNAASGYWTIGHGCMAPVTALSAYRASFAQGVIESLARLADGTPRVLLVAYDGESAGPLAQVSPSTGLLAAALVLARIDAAEGASDATRLHFELLAREGAVDADDADDRLTQQYRGNAMAPMLPLLAMLATGADACVIDAGPHQLLRIGRST